MRRVDRARSRALVHLRPLVPAVVASAAVPGLLPPAKVGDEHYLDGGIVNSIPVGRAALLGATRIFVLQVGRIDRPLTPPKRPWEVARVSFEIARRHRFIRELAELPEGVEAHVLPAAGTSVRDDSIFAFRDFSVVTAKIEATYLASAAYLDEWSRQARPPKEARPEISCDLAAPAHCPGAGRDRADHPDLGHHATVADRLRRPLPVRTGRLRVLRLLWIFILYLTCESLLLLVMFVLWLSSGFGWRMRTPYFEAVHYDLVQMVMWFFFREARRVARLKIETVGPAPDAHPGKPILVCCRHAGPGDSFTLIHTLMHWYGREPRVVLKDTLAWDPAIDVLLRRIPARFISPNPATGDHFEEQIAALATGLDENDAFVIFPEGGNFTPARRERAIERLRSSAWSGWRCGPRR